MSALFEEVAEGKLWIASDALQEHLSKGLMKDYWEAYKESANAGKILVRL